MSCNHWNFCPLFGVGHFAGFGSFGSLLTLLAFFFIFYLIAKAILSLFSQAKAFPGRQDSLAILKNRFAKGDITKEEYNRMKEMLMG